MKNVLRLLGALAIVALGIVVTLYLDKTKPEAVPAPASERTWPVRTVKISLGPQTPAVTLFGRTESPSHARISAGITADVVAVHAREGTLVTAGAPMLNLDDRDAKLRLRQREAELAELQAELELEAERRKADELALAHDSDMLVLSRSAVTRAQDLAGRNLGSRSQLDTARQDETRQRMALDNRRSALRSADARVTRLQARVAKAEAIRDQARLDVQRAEISAPFPGRISRVHVAAGERARAGDPLLEMFDIRTVELRAQIPLRYLDSIRSQLGEGRTLTATVTVDGTTLDATLDRLGAQVADNRGGVDALFRLQSAPRWLGIGRTTTLALDLAPVNDSAAVPLEALYASDRIFKVIDGRMVGITVERLGERSDPSGSATVLVRSTELTTGDTIVATHLPNAIDGLRVKSIQ